MSAFSCVAPAVAVDLVVDGPQTVVEVLEVVQHAAAVLFEQREPGRFGARARRTISTYSCILVIGMPVERSLRRKSTRVRSASL